MHDPTVTVSRDDAAARLGLRPRTLDNLRARGGGPPFVQIGGRVRYRLVDLADWLDLRVRFSTSDPGPR